MDQLNETTALERKLAAKANLAHMPLTVNFELTPNCNFNCDMCYIRMTQSEIKENGGLLSLETWLDIAKSFKKKGTLFILLTGGEPLLYPHFVDLYTSLREMGFIITINTNGSLITEEIALLFTKIKPRRVNVTLYGASAETYNRLCHNLKGYENCIHALNLLSKSGVDTKLNISVLKQNIQDYSFFYSIANYFKIPLEVNSYMFPCLRRTCVKTRSILNERLGPKEAAIAEIEYLKYKKGGDYVKSKLEFAQWFKLGNPNLQPLGLDCRAGKSSCWINWQGRMSPCVAMEEPSISLREHSVDEAWNFIVEESQKLEKHIECAGCKLRPICDVCYAAACHEKKAVGNLSHLCEMAQWKKKYLLEE